MMSGSPAVAAVYDRRQYSNLRDRRRSFLEAARYRACASRTAATVAILDFLCKAPGIRERLSRRVFGPHWRRPTTNRQVPAFTATYCLPFTEYVIGPD